MSKKKIEAFVSKQMRFDDDSLNYLYNAKW